MKRILAILVVVILFSSGCKDNPTGPSASNEIWPLKPGNVWLYFVEYLDMGVIDTLRIEITGTLNVNVDGKTLQAAKVVYHSNSSPRPPWEWLYWTGPDGVYVLGGISDKDTLVVKSLEIKYPASRGDSWDFLSVAYSVWRERFYVRDTLTRTLVATDEILQTPAGKYRSHVYQFSMRPADDIAVIWDYKYYYSPGIGLVGHFAVSPTEENFLKEKLLLWKYSIKR